MIISEIHWLEQSGYPILLLLQIVPVMAVGLITLLRKHAAAFGVAVAMAVIELLFALDLYRQFDTDQSAMQFAETVKLLGPINYHVAADGVTVLFMLLTALLSLLIVLYARIRQLTPLPVFWVLVFGIEASVQSMFATQDLAWFTIMSVIELTMVGYVLRRWANAPQEDLAMRRYMQFMGTGLLLLTAGVFMLGWNYADSVYVPWTFDLHDLIKVPVPDNIQSVIFFLLFYGLAIRIPLFPLHGWLPLMAEHGTVAVAGVFLLSLKVGVYGLLRFVFPLLPDAVLLWHDWVVAFAVTGIFYAAILARMQTNLRRLLAFAVVSHTSVLVIGLFSLTHLAFQGSIMLSVNFGLATACLLFMTGFIYRRTHTLSLQRLGGLYDHIPFIGIAFLIAGLSIIGMPGTPGFDAAHLMLEASIRRFGALVTIAAALGNVAAAAFLLWAFQRAFLSPLEEGVPAREIVPASFSERFIAGTMIVILLGVGFYSEPWLNLIESSLVDLSALYATPADAGGH